MIGLMSLHNGKPIVAPELKRRRAMFVLGRIDEILAWERKVQLERDTRFVDLGRYLCEVRSGQYWRVRRWDRLTNSSRGGSPNPAARPTT